MLIKLFTTVMLLCCVLSFPAFAQTGLFVTFPHIWGNRYMQQGTLEKCDVVATPQGGYIEYDLYLELSGRQLWNWGSGGDTMELTLNFNLPPRSIVHDSWLWVGDTIVQAMLIDRVVAQATYDSIVRRRTDPSLLVKTSPTNYTLSIYPHLRNQPRKVKISFMLPAEWKNGMLTTISPLDIFKTLTRNFITPSSFRFFVQETEEFRFEGIGNTVREQYTPYSDTLFGDGIMLEINDILAYATQPVTYRSTSDNGVFLQVQQKGDEVFYQLTVDPSGIFTPAPKKYMLLLDHSSDYDLSAQAYFTQLSQALRRELSEVDSLILVLPKGISNSVLPTQWQAATPDNINAICQTAAEQMAVPNSIQNLFDVAFNFLEAHDYKYTTIPDVHLLFMTNTNYFFRNITAPTALVQNIANRRQRGTYVHALLYHQNSGTLLHTTVQGVGTFAGNGFFNARITNVTGGVDVGYSSGDFNTRVSELFNKINNNQSGVFEMQTRLAQGLTYNRYGSASDGNFSGKQIPFQEVGRIAGNLPMDVTLVHIDNGTFVMETMTVTNDMAVKNGYKTDKIWASHYLRNAEPAISSPAAARALIDTSRRYRVLSTVTAFLALEPWMMSNPNLSPVGDDDDDDRGIVSVADNLLANKLSVKITPNPLTREGRIIITTVDDNVPTQGMNIVIHDILGNEVFRHSVAGQQTLARGEQLSFPWNATDKNGMPLASGVYILSVQTPTGKISIRFIVAQ